MKEKTADKLFEELGYKKIRDDENKVIYENEKKSKFILFNKEEKAVEVSAEYGLSELIYTNELQAINKKCQELGWI